MKELTVKSKHDLDFFKLYTPDRRDLSALWGYVAWDISGVEVRRVSTQNIRRGKFKKLTLLPKSYKGKHLSKREMLFLAKVYKKWGSYAILKPEDADSLLALHRAVSKADAMHGLDKGGVLVGSLFVPLIPSAVIGAYGISFLPVYGIGCLASLVIGGIGTYLLDVLPTRLMRDKDENENIFQYSKSYLPNEWSKLPSALRERLQIGNPVPSKINEVRVPKNVPRKEITSQKEGSWDNHLSLLAAVKEEWAEWEMDILKVVQYPALFDMRESSTVGFHRELMYAESVKPQSGETYDASHPFAKSVAGLQLAWTVAKSEARRIAQSNFGKEERVRLSRAMDLLRIALNAAGTSAERQASYQRAMKQLEGLVEIPAAAKAEIESGAQLKVLETHRIR